MPKNIAGGGETGPAPPGGAAAPESGYNLRVPVAADVADTPADMERLATDVKTQLDLRLTEASALRAYQPKVVVRTTRPASATEYPDGTIIFVVGG